MWWGNIYHFYIFYIIFSKNTLRGVYGVWTFERLTSTAARTCSHGAYWSCAPCEWRERVCQCAASGRGPEDLQVWSATRVDQLIGDKIQPTFYNGNAGMFIMLYKLGIKQPTQGNFIVRNQAFSMVHPRTKAIFLQVFCAQVWYPPGQLPKCQWKSPFCNFPSLTGKYNYLETFQPLRFVHFHQLETPLKTSHPIVA